MHDEAQKIITLSQKHLSLEKTKELFIALDEEVGKTSSNQSVKELLEAARLIVDPPLIVPFYLWFAFVGLVVVHMLLVIGIVASFFILPFYMPWYVALPTMVFIWFFSTSKIDCKLTNLENDIRVKLGMKRIGGFVGNYVLKPARIYLLRRNGRPNRTVIS